MADGTVVALPRDVVTARWSRDGTRVVVAGSTSTTIYDRAARPTVSLPISGWNPRWSRDNEYIGLVSPQNADVVRVFDSSSGREVLRSYGRPSCIGDYWVADRAIGWDGSAEATLVPGGEPVSVEPPGPPTRLLDSPDGSAVQLVDAGVVVAEARLATTTWVSAFSGADAGYPESAGLGVIWLGVGGRGACDSGDLEVRAELPPFTGEPVGWP